MITHRIGKTITLFSFFCIGLLFSLTCYGETSNKMGTPQVSAEAGSGTGGGTVLPDLFSGTLSYSMPIKVPPGATISMRNLTKFEKK